MRCRVALSAVDAGPSRTGAPGQTGSRGRIACGERRPDWEGEPMKLSILMPAYNEAETVQDALGRVLKTADSLPCEVEIVVVDDGSRDDTAELVRALDDGR